jgi:uncharacterized protein YdhG (YjbR/CyaY superfamily)
MAKARFASVDDYIAAQHGAAQKVLARVRSTIRKALPGSEESISYHMPTYKLQGERLLYFAGWSKHYSLYPATEAVVAAFAEELGAYEVEKGTIRFPLDQPVPTTLIAGIARLRAEEVRAFAQPKAAARKPASKQKVRARH